jgi:uncharacterized RDD family membrane protein YckC
MAIELSCTGCGRTLRVGDDAGGKHARCPACGQVSRVPEPAATAPISTPDPRSHGVPSGYAPSRPIASADRAEMAEAPAKPNPFSSAGFNPFGDVKPAPATPNPYQAPTAFGYAPPRHTTWPLAAREKRLGGYLLDRVIVFAAAIPGFVLVGIGEETNQEEVSMIGAFVLLGGMLAVGIVNWVMIAQRGQSIAKRMLRMQMVRIDNGQPAGFVHGVILRSWVLGLAYGLLGTCILFTPFSLLLFLVDACLIFGEDRRCLHDQLAQTVVIDV